MNYRLLLGLLTAVVLSACGGDVPDDPTVSTDPAPAAAAPPAGNTLPSIPIERLEYLYTNATYMDATFYKMPVSINQSELPQIQSTLTGIGAEPMPLLAACEALGHIWFQVNGKNVEEADIYFQPECVGYVWYENGRPAYSNKLTESGLQFYSNIMQSVQQNTGQ